MFKTLHWSVSDQRWANSVLVTEYEYYSASQKWPNTNTNIIRLSKKDRIRIRILFGFPKMTEYEYYSDPQKYIAETSQTNANSVSMQSCMHTIQVNIWIHTVGKMFTNPNNVRKGDMYDIQLPMKRLPLLSPSPFVSTLNCYTTPPYLTCLLLTCMWYMRSDQVVALSPLNPYSTLPYSVSSDPWYTRSDPMVAPSVFSYCETSDKRTGFHSSLANNYPVAVCFGLSD